MDTTSILNAAPPQPADKSDSAPVEKLSCSRLSVASSQLTAGTIVDICDADNKRLFSARIAEATDAAVSLVRLPGSLSFPVLPSGTEIRICTLTPENIMYTFSGATHTSDRRSCLIADLSSNLPMDRRSSYRIPVGREIRIFDINDTELQDGGLCTLVNVCNSGACFASSRLYEEGRVLTLEFNLNAGDPIDHYAGEVIWTKQLPSGLHSYGFLFAELTDDKSNSLSKYIHRAWLISRYDKSMTVKESK